MFVLRPAGSADARNARVRVEYGNETVGIGGGQVSPGVEDQSLLVLSLLSELVNSAKISSDIPGTQQLQVLP
jgi:hypothetical protein